MHLIKRLLLLIALLLTTFCSGLAFAEKNSAIDFSGTISAVRSYENDILNTKDNEISFSNVAQQSSTISNRRNSTSGSASLDNNFLLSSNFEFDNHAVFKDKFSSLSDSAGITLRLLLYQIVPNAP